MTKFAILIFILIAVLAVAVSGCAKTGKTVSDATTLEELEARTIEAEGEHIPLDPETGEPITIPTGNTKGFLAPDFAITTTDGKTVSLSQLTSEKPTLLYFWATWCPFCKRDLAAANNVYPKYKDKVAFLAIDLDTRESVQLISRYKREGNHDFIDFAPADVNVLQAYGITHTTTKIAVGKNRVILWRGSGEVDEKTWETILSGLASS